VKPPLPAEDSPAYLWWAQGARDNQDAHDEKLNPAARELRDAVESFAQGYGQSATIELLLTGLMKIYCPAKLKRRFR
jgi:hypothetical protein